ncbi:MAG: peptidase [Candidatus Azotimanducaceae bacterium WSBS_2022_MAG_OTU7]
MTYCLAIATDSGLVFVSDSRTNAGVDMVSTYSKMYGFGIPGQKQFTVLTSGNLATSQSVISQIKKDIKKSKNHNILTMEHMTEVAEYLGDISTAEQEKTDTSVNAQSYFLVGGQILDHKPAIYMVYPQGNYISTSSDTTYLQIGESKYGKPILDRILTPEVSLETAAMCALVSMDSTIRSNLSVGPPIDLSIYPRDSLHPGKYYRFEEDSKYLRQLKKNWDQLLKDSFKKLPPVAWSTTWDKESDFSSNERTT